MKDKAAFGFEVEAVPDSQVSLGVAAETDNPAYNQSLNFMPDWLRRTGCLALSVLVGSVGTAALPAELAEAANNYSQRVPPTVTHPRKTGHQDNGVVIANVPYGYYIGRAYARSKVKETVVTKAKDYAFGAITQSKGGKAIIQCGWIESESLSTNTRQLQESPPCAKQQKLLTNEYKFGHGFNCGPGVCDGGTFTTHLTPQCDDKLYANDASLDVAIAKVSPSRRPHKVKGVPLHKVEGLYDYLGRLDNNEPVHYRYTTNDEKAAVIMSNTYGWGFVSKQCIAGYPQGGGLKTSS
jgi:hypothetical protein